MAEAFDPFWRELRAQPPSPQSVNVMPGPVLVVWFKQGSGWRAIFAGPTRVAAIAQQINIEQKFTIVLSDRAGLSIGGRQQTALLRRAAAETGLPWNISVNDADPLGAAALIRSRRLTFVGALALVSLLIVISGYFTFRGIRRELDTAHQQAEFVSAVSHEFRTPLTSIRQLSHMLRGGRVPDEAKRGQYYEVLVRESERLHRLIERLLSLGRAEARRYRFESTDACELARAVVTDFRNRDRERSIELVLAASPCQLQADREMLALAVWNLLENAAKYSPHDRPVRVDVSTGEGQVAIAVRDEGAGIPPEDRVRIFEQFVRGADRDVAGTPGTGLGLALVDRVVRAHGGTVRLDSELGHGARSRF